jgi:uncharacterized protein
MAVKDAIIYPFHTFLWKIASRCNLDCSYCYVYNRGDEQWRRQPQFMSEDTAATVAKRMLEHCQAHNKNEASIVFHGGEPLMAGADRIAKYADIIGSAFSPTNISLTVGIQSNGLLFNDAIGDVLVRRGITIGVSLDGPPTTNDRHRVDKRGRPTSRELERRLRLLTHSRFKGVFTGFLCVIDISSDPVETLDYLLSFSPPCIDFLLPLDNYDRRPVGKEYLGSAPYGEWLTKAFDHWISVNSNTEIRIFSSLIGLMAGAPSLVENLGTDPVDLIVVETNGELEAVDSLKASFDGATQLGYDVRTHAFDEVSKDIRVKARQIGTQGLSSACRACDLVGICGGGYIPHRYSQSNGFDNPSVYCSDLTLLIRHIKKSLVQARSAAC